MGMWVVVILLAVDVIGFADGAHPSTLQSIGDFLREYSTHKKNKLQPLNPNAAPVCGFKGT